MDILGIMLMAGHEWLSERHRIRDNERTNLDGVRRGENIVRRRY